MADRRADDCARLGERVLRMDDLVKRLGKYGHAATVGGIVAGYSEKLAIEARDRIEALEAEQEAVVRLLEEVRGILRYYTGSTAAQDGTDCLEYKRDITCLDRVEWMIAQITGIPR